MLETEIGPIRPEDAATEASALAEYAEVSEHVRWLADVRFKLLAILPASTGFAVFQVLDSKDQAITLGTGLFGAWVTLCLYVYHLRNDQLYNDLVGRLREIEKELKLRRGAFFRRVPTWGRFLGLSVEHGWPIKGIYYASFTAWVLLAASGVVTDDVGLLGGTIAGGALVGGTALFGHLSERSDRARIDGVSLRLRRFLVDGGDPKSLAPALLHHAPHLIDGALSQAGVPRSTANSSDKLQALAQLLEVWRADTGAKYSIDQDKKIGELLGFSRYKPPKLSAPPTLPSAPAPTSPGPAPTEGGPPDPAPS